MSLILKGIDLPKDEKKPLKIEIWSNGDVYKNYGYGYEHNEGITIQIPKGHGRIGDLDELKADIHMNRLNKYATRRDVDATYRAIDNAPTILEAEGEEQCHS